MVPTFEKRVRAFAIDTSGVALMLILAWPLQNNFPGTLGVVLSYSVPTLAIIGFYFLPYFFSKGQSFGKRIQKVKLVNLDGSDVPLWKVLLREAFKLTLSVCTFGVYFIVAFFMLDERTSRTIHDYVFKTKLIDLEPRRAKETYFGTTESLRKRGL